MLKRNRSSTCNNCLGLSASHLKGFDKAWKTHVITLCEDHLNNYRDACDCMYKRAMGIGSGEPAWKDGKWAQLYADRKAYIEEALQGVNELEESQLEIGPGPAPPQKRARLSPKNSPKISTKSEGTQTDGPPNPDFGDNSNETEPDLACDEISVPASPDYALEAEAQMACSNWTEQDPDEAVKRWNDALKPLPSKKKKSKYVFYGDN